MTALHRTLTRDELDEVLDWAAAEGWNPGLDDAAAFCAADPGGIFGAVVDGRLAAAITVVNHTDAFAFLGLYLCRPDMRGQGIAFGLWQTALAHAGTRTVGLDGVPAQQANYRRSGFEPAGGTVRFGGALPQGDAAGVRQATADDIPRLVALEGRASGVDKPRYMAAWFAPAETRRTFATEDGAGLVTVRRCRSGCKIGPLVARDAPQARTLLAAAAAFAGGADTSVDVPAANGALTDLCRDIGLSPGFDTVRMYRGPAPRPDSALYAVATLELG